MSDKKQNEGNIAEKLARLNEMVAWFEGDDFVVEEALERFAAAEKLAGEIEAELASFKNKITILKQDFSKE